MEHLSLRNAMALLRARALVCDLDDTFLNTNIIFSRQIELFCTAIHLAIPSISQAEIVKQVNQLNNEIYQTHAIKSTNWYIIAERLVVIYGESIREVIYNALSFISQIYKTVPDLRTGVLEFMKEVKDQEIPLAIITHANEAWTDLKIQSHGLHFYIEQLHIVPEEVHKGASHWKMAVDALKVDPSEVIALGDSILTDMWPAHECGIKKLIWVDKPDGWGLYRNGTLPTTACTIKEIPEVIPLIRSLPRAWR